MPDIDFQHTNWWLTISGAGTPDAQLDSWANDYTRHRSGGLEDTYKTPDSKIGRVKTCRELDKNKV
jgi:hypothetical protein